ncbi:transglycosylase domain-containing protein [uncultured Eubacterium sp.]|uniref:transglycosylase domain-containing protein n=1 Tax=uncultured Eubacterium sp. TaxID=165185 RepID=UPI0028051849|nr:transglycosylase domain-containing protein [uncultured Eubacterium sp.]
MANKDYDDLLESFMNNSQKAYNDDRETRKKSGGKLPPAYNTFSSGDNSKKNKSSYSAAGKSNNNKNRKVNKTPGQKTAGVFGKIILGIILVVAVVGIICSSVLFVYGYSVVHGDVVFNLEDEASSQNQTSFIYGYDNNNKLIEITRLHGEENRIWLDKNDMTKYMSKAFIAIEDERFEKHHGVDWKRTIGVMVKPSNSGQGGSTITQQLIKNLTDENDVTFIRKFNEILSALNLEKHYSKDEIMEAYLNTIYLSHGCYGVKTAAETYFGKEVKDLNIAECACIASITQFPTYYDPLLNPENNRQRQLRVLKKMLERGFISQQEYDEAVAYKMVFTNSPDYKGSQIKKSASEKKQAEKVNSYYTDYVIDQVINDLQNAGYSAKKAKKLIYGGGLKIYSAIDFDVQNAIEDVYENYKKMPDETVQGACVIMDYHGRILGMVGGTGKKKANRVLNRAWQSKRQPGSVIKPLSVYGPALEKTLQDGDTNVYWSTPTKDAPLTKIDGKPWPTNEGGSYSGETITVQKGLALSKNTISARTLDKIGTTYSYEFITNKFHISTLAVQDCDLAPMATGSLTYGVTVLEMTTAYQAFGNGGYYYEGYSYYKIEDSQGNVILEKNPEKDKEIALSENTSWVMNKMLQTVMTEGTGRSYKIDGVECIGKTGTTTGSNDRWFIGGTPEYVGGVWYGYDKNKEVRYYLSANPSGTIWNTIMKEIYDKKGKNVKEFPECDGIVHRQYSSSGTLSRGSGRWGWFDVNNLPKTASNDYLSDYDSGNSYNRTSSATKRREEYTEDNSDDDSNDDIENPDENPDDSSDNESEDNSDEN